MQANDAGDRPTFARVRSVVESHFQATPDFQRNDLITREDVAPVVRELEALGWTDVAKTEAVKQLPSDSEPFVRELRSAQGRVFMRRVSGYRLIYDRLDRISRMPGGQALIRDLVKLPDGHRYARTTPGRGVPSLTDFLPKGASGKAPQVKDIDQPTGRIYTVEALLRQLEQDHRNSG